MSSTTAAMPASVKKPSVQKEDAMWLQKELINKNYMELATARQTGRKVSATFVPGNLTELVRSFDLLPVLPDAPTIGETVKGFGATPWYGVFAPAGTPKHIVTLLNAEIAKAQDAKDVQERLAGAGCEPYKSTPEQFAQLVRDDLPRWARTVKDSGATID